MIAALLPAIVSAPRAAPWITQRDAEPLAETVERGENPLVVGVVPAAADQDAEGHIGDLASESRGKLGENR